MTVAPSPVATNKIAGLKKAKPGFNRKQIVNLIAYYLSAMSLGLSYKGIMTFLPAYMGEKVHIGFMNMDTVALGGTIATIALLSGALGQYTAGRLVDRYKTEALYLISIFIGTIFVFLMANGSGLLLVISAVIYAFFYFATQPIQNFLISNYLPTHRHGLGYGLHFFLTFGVGSTAAAVSGYLADHFGLQAVFYAMGFCFAAAFRIWTCPFAVQAISPSPSPSKSAISAAPPLV